MQKVEIGNNLNCLAYIAQISDKDLLHTARCIPT